MGDFWEDIKNQKCSCSLLKKAKKDFTYKNQMIGNKKPTYLFLFEFQEDREFLNLWMKLLVEYGYSLHNSSFLNSIGCRPKDNKLQSIVYSFQNCFNQNALTQIIDVKPKIIFTFGRAIYSITGDSFLTKGKESKNKSAWEDFIDFNSITSTFYSPKVNAIIIPLPSLISFINYSYIQIWNDNLNKYEKRRGHIKILDNFETSFVRNQLSLAKSIITQKISFPLYRLKKHFIKKEDTKDVLLFLKNNLDIKFIAVDTETSGKTQEIATNPRLNKLISIQIAISKVEGYFFEYDKSFNSLFSELFLSKKCIFQNAMFDINTLRYKNMKVNCYFDTALAYHFCINSNYNYRLNALVYKYTPYGGYWEELDKYKEKYNITDYGSIPIEILKDYAIMDAISTFMIYERINKKLEKNVRLKDFYFRDINPVIEPFLQMENTGFIFNKEINNELNKQLIPVKEDLGKEIVDKLKLQGLEDISSNEKLGYAFENVLKLQVSPEGRSKTKRKTFKVGDKALLYWENKGSSLISKIREYREINKLLNDFIGNEKDNSGLWKYLQSDGRIRSHYLITGTKSGRVSSFNLNLQQVPKHSKYAKSIRQQFGVPQGWKILEFDYSGFQLRIMAILSGDKNMRRIFTSDYNDIHLLTALGLGKLQGILSNDLKYEYAFDVFHKGKDKDKQGVSELIKKLKSLRVLSKGVNFGYLFGRSAYSFALDEANYDIQKIDTMDKIELYKEYVKYNGDDSLISERSITTWDLKLQMANTFRQSFFDSYPKVLDYINNQHKQAGQQGYVETIKGMRRYVTPLKLNGELDYGKDENLSYINNLKNISVNSPVQGFEAHIIFSALIKLFNLLKNYKSLLAGTVHDSILIISPEEEVDIIKEKGLEILEFRYRFYRGIPIIADLEVSDIWGFTNK